MVCAAMIENACLVNSVHVLAADSSATLDDCRGHTGTAGLYFRSLANNIRPLRKTQSTQEIVQWPCLFFIHRQSPQERDTFITTI